MAKKTAQATMGTDTVERKIDHLEDPSDMFELITKEVDGEYEINEEAITTWKLTVEICREQYEEIHKIKLTNKMIADSCGVSEDTIKKEWTKRIPPSREKTVNFAYALGLELEDKKTDEKRLIADDLICKHGGYTRLLAIYEDDLVDMYLFSHRERTNPQGQKKYNDLHEEYLKKLQDGDKSDKDFLDYCNRSRLYAKDNKQDTIDFLERYAPPEFGKPLEFLKYLANDKIAASIRSACNDSVKRFERDELILLGLKLRMPRSLIDDLLELSGHHRLYARNLLESWLIFNLDQIFIDAPYYFSLGNAASELIISEYEHFFEELRDNSADGVSLYGEVFDRMCQKDGRIMQLAKPPLWLNKSFLVEYEKPDLQALEGKERTLRHFSKYMQRSKVKVEEDSKTKREKFAFINYLVHPETVRKLKAVCLQKEGCFERDELILLGLKLRMPRRMIDYLLRVSNHHELYAESFPESRLAELLEEIFREHPSCFGMGNEASERMICEFEPDFAKMKAEDAADARKVSPYCRVYEAMRREFKADGLPLWVREEYLPEYESEE